MPSLNKAMVIGHLGQDPEMRYAPDGTAFATLNVASSFYWNDRQSNERKEETEWHRISLRGKLAEVANEYLRKGALVFVEGRLRTRKWQDKEGKDRYTTEIIAYDMKMLGPKTERQEERSKPAEKKAEKASEKKPPAGKFDDLEDDIPF